MGSVLIQNDVAAPVISGVVSIPTATGATITWNTNEFSDTQVFYGTSAAYGSSTPLNQLLVKNGHNANLSGLTPGTLYYYQVRSKDASDRTVTFSGTFQTQAAAQFTLRVSPSVQAVAQGEATAYTVSVDRQPGFTGVVTVNSSNLPSGAYTTFSNQFLGVGQTSTMVLRTGGSTPAVDHQFAVNGTATGSLASSANGVAQVEAKTSGIMVLRQDQVATAGGSQAWEPHAVAGASGWAVSWTDVGATSVSYIARWAGSGGNPWQVACTLPGTAYDVYLEFDSFRQRYVFTWIQSNSDGTIGVRYGHMDDSDGAPCTIEPAWVFAATNPGWDYPSLGVSGDGRVIVGAVAIGTRDFAVRVSSNGATFPAAHSVAAPLADLSRVIATDTMFHVFTPKRGDANLVDRIERRQSSNGTDWSAPEELMQTSLTFPDGWKSLPASTVSPVGFPAPPVEDRLYYAGEQLDARGAPNGHWIVGFQTRLQEPGRTNCNDPNWCYQQVWMCTPASGCQLVNRATADEFLPSVSVSRRDGSNQPDSWVSYLTFHQYGWRILPLIQQAIYYPPGNAIGIGATIHSAANPDIDPLTWRRLLPSNFRCFEAGQYCYAAGDYLGLASNPFAGGLTAFIDRTASGFGGVFSTFFQDPPVPAASRAFVPRPFRLTPDVQRMAHPFRFGPKAGDPRNRIGPHSR